jgi:hypothetical protein
MDYEDHFHPNNNELDKNVEEIKQFDKGYCKLKRNVLTRNGFIKKGFIDVYVSGAVGSKIRDATTGYSFNDRVGSSGSDKYFKVAVSTGEIKAKNGLNILYYSSPYDYENHMSCKLDDAIIDKWNDSQN